MPHEALKHTDPYILDHIPAKPRTYRQCFRDEGNDFSKAGEEWVTDRIALFPFLETSHVAQQLIDTSLKNISQFDEKILTHYFYKLAPHLARCAGIEFWSEGIREFQEGKVGVVTEHLAQYGGNREIGISVSENKLDSIGEITRMSEQLSFGRRTEEPPIVVLEDKIVNMINLMLNIYHKTSWDIKEADLDKPDFPFEDFLTRWEGLIYNNPENFSRYKFIYIPPDKPGNGDNGLSISPLRQERIKKLFAVGNTALKAALSSPELIAENPTEDHFFHIDYFDDDVKLQSVFTPKTFVVADVDGPLVSQERVLWSRERILSETFFNIIKPAYEDLFQMSFDNIMDLILSDDDIDPEVAYMSILTNDSTKPIFKRLKFPEVSSDDSIKVLVAKFPPNPNSSRMLKNLYRLRIQRYDLGKHGVEYTYYFSVEQFLEALRSLDLRVYFT